MTEPKADQDLPPRSTAAPVNAAAKAAETGRYNRNQDMRATRPEFADADDSKTTYPAQSWVEPGTPAYRRVAMALFLAGFATFSLIYCVQPLLPAFADDFAVSPTQSSLALSLTTGFLAFSILLAGAASEAFGRRRLMFVSMCAASALNIADAFIPDWHVLLVARALEGFVLGGVPAVAMAYLAEEIHPRGLGLAMGLYVGGTAFGGMAGRVGVGLLTEFSSWEMALGVLGGLDLLAAIGFFILLPPSRNFTTRPGFQLAYHIDAWAKHLRHPALPFVFVIGALSMGCFVTVYNYAGFRMVADPYNLGQGAISLIFMVYLFGMAASSIAGGLADKHGRGPVMAAGILVALAGVALTLMGSIYGVIGGIIVLTSGFFMAHSVASGWVGRMAKQSKGHASSLYLLSYYLGSSVMGSIGGWFWTQGGWSAVAGFAGALLVIALLVSGHLWRYARRVETRPV